MTLRYPIPTFFPTTSPPRSVSACNPWLARGTAVYVQSSHCRSEVDGQQLLRRLESRCMAKDQGMVFCVACRKTVRSPVKIGSQLRLAKVRETSSVKNSGRSKISWRRSEPVTSLGQSQSRGSISSPSGPSQVALAVFVGIMQQLRRNNETADHV